MQPGKSSVVVGTAPEFPDGIPHRVSGNPVSRPGSSRRTAGHRDRRTVDGVAEASPARFGNRTRLAARTGGRCAARCAGLVPGHPLGCSAPDRRHEKSPCDPTRTISDPPPPLRRRARDRGFARTNQGGSDRRIRRAREENQEHWNRRKDRSFTSRGFSRGPDGRPRHPASASLAFPWLESPPPQRANDGKCNPAAGFRPCRRSSRRP